MFSPLNHAKVNISDFYYNELEMLDMGFLLSFGLNENQIEKCKYVMSQNVTSHIKREVLF